jgi:uncharacterized OB-fold protein
MTDVLAITPDWLVVADLAPDPTDVLAPLYEAAARGELRLPHCDGCGLALELEQRVCDGCGAGPGSVVWRGVEPAGHVHSVTVVHRREPGLVRTEKPYPIADVELVSGHRLLMASMHPTDGAPAIGSPIDVDFGRVGDVAVPRFVPRPTEPAAPPPSAMPDRPQDTLTEAP